MIYIHLNPFRAGMVVDLKDLAKYPHGGRSVLLKGDERILGDSDFVKEILSEQKERFELRDWLQAQGYDIDRVGEKAAKDFEMEPAEVRKSGIQPLRVKARNLVCF